MTQGRSACLARPADDTPVILFRVASGDRRCLV